MFFNHLSDSATSQRTARLSVEALDDRLVLASLSVGEVVIYEPIPAGTVQYAEVRVSLDAPAHKTVSVNYSTANGTATAGSDYAAVSGQLTFAPGQTSQTVLVPVRADDQTEGRETFFVNLSGARGARIGDTQGTVTIVDDVLRLSINDVSQQVGLFGNPLFTFTVTLSSASDEAVTINYATADGTATAYEDYWPTSGTLTFAPGEMSKTTTVEVFNYTHVWPEEFVVNLSGASGNVVIADDQGIGHISSEVGGGE